MECARMGMNLRSRAEHAASQSSVLVPYNMEDGSSSMLATYENDEDEYAPYMCDLDIAMRGSKPGRLSDVFGDETPNSESSGSD